MVVLKLALVVITVFATACTGKSNPAAPTEHTPPTATNLLISGVDAVRTGLFSNYTVTATLSDGTTRAVTPTWTSSNTGVASIDSAGRLEGRAHGSITLTASHEGRSASKAVQVVNNYEGTWEGLYVVRTCEDSGSYEDGVFAPPYEDVPYCQFRQRTRSEYTIKLALSQTGTNQSEIRATLNESNPILGVVTADGRLNLAGRIELPDWYGEILEVMQIGGWNTNLSGPGEMTGRWSENLVSVFDGAGNVYMENELLTMIRTSTSVTPPSATR